MADVDTDRAVSTTVSYVLVLGITSLLISGLLISTGGMVESRQDATSREALDVIGQRIAANLMAADRLAETDPETAAVGVSLPDRVANDGYGVTVNGSSSTVVLAANRADARVTVEFVASTPVADATVTGGDLRIVLTGSGDLEVRSA